MQHNRSYVTIKEECQNIFDEYQHDLQMYINPPSGNIRLENFQQICLDRLKVLKLVDRIAMTNHKRPSVICKTILLQELEKYELFDFAKLVNAPGCMSHTDVDLYLRRMDHISHIILRSAFAFNRAKRIWFFKQEVKLFKWRVSSLNIEGINKFIDINRIDYLPISFHEKMEYKEELHSILPNDVDFNSLKFYKIPFIEIPNLIKKRSVLLKDGLAFVPEDQLGSLFVTLFRRNLCSSFAYSREIAVTLSGDVRITKIFETFPNSVSARKCDNGEYGSVSIEELDDLAETSFPLCMRVLHEALKAKHHLTNGGRVQYGLFLKGIGLNLEDAMHFWKTEYMKKENKESFIKEQMYDIRHLYGVVGAKRDYKPYDCVKIMDSTIGPRDNHGCPYKHMSSEKLVQKLVACGLTTTDADEIADLAKKNLPLAACSRYFELLNDCSIENTFSHPNKYYEKSRALREDVDISDKYL